MVFQYNVSAPVIMAYASRLDQKSTNMNAFLSDLEKYTTLGDILYVLVKEDVKKV